MQACCACACRRTPRKRAATLIRPCGAAAQSSTQQGSRHIARVEGPDAASCRAVQKQHETKISQISDLRKQVHALNAQADEIKRVAHRRAARHPGQRASGERGVQHAEAETMNAEAASNGPHGPHLHPAVLKKIEELQLGEVEALRFQLDYLLDVNRALAQTAADQSHTIERQDAELEGLRDEARQQRHTIERQDAELERLREDAGQLERILDAGAARLSFCEEQRDASLLLVRKVIAEGKQLELKRRRLLELILDEEVPQDHKQAMRGVVLGGSLEEATRLLRLVERSVSLSTPDDADEHASEDSSATAAPDAEFLEDALSIRDTLDQSLKPAESEPGDSGSLEARIPALTPHPTPEPGSTNHLRPSTGETAAAQRSLQWPAASNAPSSPQLAAGDSCEHDGVPVVMVKASMRSVTRAAPKIAPAITTPALSVQTAEAPVSTDPQINSETKHECQNEDDSTATNSTVSPASESESSESRPVCVEESALLRTPSREQVSICIGARGEQLNGGGLADGSKIDTNKGAEEACKAARLGQVQTASTGVPGAGTDLANIDIFIHEAKCRLQESMDELKEELSKASTVEESFLTYQRCMQVECVFVCVSSCVYLRARVRCNRVQSASRAPSPISYAAPAPSIRMPL